MNTTGKPDPDRITVHAGELLDLLPKLAAEGRVVMSVGVGTGSNSEWIVRLAPPVMASTTTGQIAEGVL